MSKDEATLEEVTVKQLVEMLESLPQHLPVTLDHRLDIVIEECKAAYSDKPYINLRNKV